MPENSDAGAPSRCPGVFLCARRDASACEGRRGASGVPGWVQRRGWARPEVSRLGTARGGTGSFGWCRGCMEGVGGGGPVSWASCPPYPLALPFQSSCPLAPPGLSSPCLCRPVSAQSCLRPPLCPLLSDRSSLSPPLRPLLSDRLSHPGRHSTGAPKRTSSRRPLRRRMATRARRMAVERSVRVIRRSTGDDCETRRRPWRYP